MTAQMTPEDRAHAGAQSNRPKATLLGVEAARGIAATGIFVARDLVEVRVKHHRYLPYGAGAVWAGGR